MAAHSPASTPPSSIGSPILSTGSPASPAGPAAANIATHRYSPQGAASPTMVKRFGEVTTQHETDIVVHLPFPHIAANFLRSNQNDSQSGSYCAAPYVETAQSARVPYVDAGPPYRGNYFPRVYNSGVIALHMRPRQNSPFDIMRFDLVKLTHTLTEPSTLFVEDKFNRLLNLCSPTLRVTAVVQCLPKAAEESAGSQSGTPDVDRWQLGWVQGCLEYHAYAEYSNGGRITYELPSYGERCAHEGEKAPWYSRSATTSLLVPRSLNRKSAAAAASSPAKAIEQKVTHEAALDARSKGFALAFFDSIPHCAEGTTVPHDFLTRVYWKQTHRAWLILKDLKVDSLYILRSIKWSSVVEYDGQRAKVVESSSELEDCNYFPPESLFDNRETLRGSLRAVYTMPDGSDFKLSQLLAHRDESTGAPSQFATAFDGHSTIDSGRF